MPQPRLVKPYDARALGASRSRHEERIRNGMEYVMPEAEARALLEQYTEVVLQAREALQDLGVPRSDFPQMINFLIQRVDAAMQRKRA